MLGNFTYCNPTKIYFGTDALDGLNKELPKYGKNVLLYCLFTEAVRLKRTVFTIR